ncbi:cyclic diguanylate phosphodiesterase [Sphaerisporangium melleum]|uniref:Cyclic diguanylate phosphodiesterase n=1 Tax=Sphaerisporangium melleum TaxID=321316 RepID=A0A917R4R7_9ACTN|nr:helix-turn-helix domain-containing protein [Sphaerisporangium melleum]GGK89410.1 cyclic diguanylate phosphodiesterase [Sphaerisporangium melleum]GII72493.1 cyclic diguanylate phosphodiesterase [Sphaerisporangium melleum]
MSRTVFLDLLAREASPVEFEAPLVEARAAGAAPELLAELDQAKLAALRVRALLEHRARREAELSALFETAGDLAGLRDVGAVLEAIVRRARRLLHADISYMTLHDPDRGDTYMRVTDGSVSAAFRALRLPMGAGLGGLVAQTGTPYASADYFSDGRFRHAGHIDAAVKEEALVAILGVPMRLGAQIIGVLFAANRSARPFAQEEVALLASLAAHAAVALDNARLLEETRTALGELSAANRLLQARSASVERAAQAHDRMTGLVVRGGGVEDVAAVVTDILGGAIVVLDSDGRRLAEVGSAGDLDETEVGAAAAASRRLARTVRRGDLWVTSVASGAENLGTLVLRAPEAVSDADQRILERAALVTALLLLFRRTAAAAEGRVRGELLDDLLTGRAVHSDALHGRARLLGVDLDAPHVLVAARHREQEPLTAQRTAFWASSDAASRHGLVAVRGEETILLLPGLDPSAAARRVAKELGASLGTAVTAGGAGPVRGPAAVAGAYREARRCAEALLALGRAGEGAGCDELGFVGLLIGRDRDVGAFLETAIGPVLAYDRRRGTALVKTLETYFGTGSSLARTAERLHIHVNTVTQRLDRVGRLLGDGWQSPERALEIQLALRLHRLRPVTGHDLQPW